MIGECYICTEKCRHLSPCSCKERYVHLRCLIKMINASNRKYCPVCLSTFNHVKVEEKKKWLNYCKCCVLPISALLSFLISCLFTSIILMHDAEWSTQPYLLSLFMFMLFICTIIVPVMYFITSICMKSIIVNEIRHVRV